MKQVRTAALSRHAAPPFVMVSGLELMTLRRLTWLARCMFFELLGLADFTTGRGATSYAVLAALLDFDLAPQANTTPGPTVKRLRVAMSELASAGLVRLDRIKNEKAQGLFFRVRPRAGISAPEAMQGRVQGRVPKAETQATARVPGRRRADAGQGAGQGVQEPNSLPLTPSLSTGTGPPKALLDAALAATERLRAGVGKRAPKGA